MQNKSETKIVNIVEYSQKYFNDVGTFVIETVVQYPRRPMFKERVV